MRLSRKQRSANHRFASSPPSVGRLAVPPLVAGSNRCGGFSARALGHLIFTAAETEAELQAMVKDAVACHFDDGEAPKIIRLHYVREEVIQA